MSDGDKKDLTRIEDLSEFLHQGDDELDKVLSEIEAEDNALDSEDETEVELTPFEEHKDSISEDGDGFFEDETENQFEDNDQDNFEDDSFTESEFENEDFENNNFQDEDSEQNDFENAEDNFESDDFQENDLEEDGFEGNSFEDNSFEDNNSFNTDSGEEDDTEYDTEDNSKDEYPNQFESDLEHDFENENEDVNEGQYEDEDEDEIELIHDNSNEQDLDLGTDTGHEEQKQEVEFELPETANQIQEPLPLSGLNKSGPEDLSEVKDFSSNSIYGKAAIGGNPPFSILLQGINSEEYSEDIFAILNEFGLMDGNEELYKKSLENGQMLIAQIGEFSAIAIAGKLRRFARTIKVGLAHEIHQSDNYDHRDHRGLTGPRSIMQNKSKKYVKKDFGPEDVLLSTSPFIPGLKVIHSYGPMQINDQIDRSEFDDFSSINLVDYFEDTIKQKAFEIGANAVTSIHFNIGHKELDGRTYNIIMAHGDFVYLERSENN